MLPSSARASRREIVCLAALLTLGALVYLVGVAHDLPYVVQGDEVGFFGYPAARIAATGQLHPGWFGHPASTVIYPLSGIYHLWHAVAHGGAWLRPDPRLIAAFEQHIGQALLLGRLLSVAYGVGALWATYRLGRRLFDGPTALVGAALLIPVPALVLFAQMVRNDSATVFYSALALWAIVGALERPSVGRQALAGLACGLAISTKYYLGALALILLLADGVILWRGRGLGGDRRRLLAGALAGLVAVALGFALTTPYFLLDFAAAWGDLRAELRPAHLGADGLSPLQNLWWYLSVAMPGVLGWGRYLVALVGAAGLAWRGRGAPRLLLAFAGLFLLGVSASPLHWERWVFPILPVACLCCAAALVRGGRWLGQRRGLSPRSGAALAVLAGVALCATPLYDVALQGVRQTRPSTMVQARVWLDANLAPGTAIAREEYSFPTNGCALRLVGEYALAEEPLGHYIEQGAEYIAVSSAIVDRYYREPGRYREQIAFYEGLDAAAELVYEATPDRWTSGPTVKIYRLAAQGAPAGASP